MSGEYVIKAQNLSKSYNIGALPSLSKSAKGFLSAMLRSRTGTLPKQDAPEIFWALNDIAFAVREGEVLGLIGKNGAGKTTLLKILARIVKPTRGRIEIAGRVASLLEVGTGFHHELTGRENISLNGAILGMSRAEIRRKTDKIIEFSGIERFIETPVKRYSSGMKVRLAFAVAAHLDPEILLVDEVLAVGDFSFQKKCLGRMSEISSEGRTVIFVSHNMAAVQKLCSRTMLLSSGRLAENGPTGDVIGKYIQGMVCDSLVWKRKEDSNLDHQVDQVYLSEDGGSPLSVVTMSTELQVLIDFTIKRKCPGLNLNIDLLDSNGYHIMVSNSLDSDVQVPSEPGKYRATLILPKDIFLAKTYGIRSNLYSRYLRTSDRSDILQFTVMESDNFTRNSPSGGKRYGLIAMDCDWSIR